MPIVLEVMTILQNYLRAIADFDSVVAAVSADRWDEPSACTEWTCRDVLGHVVWGQHLVRHLAVGQVFASRVGAPGAPNPGRLVAEDPVGTWRAAHAASRAALRPDTLARTVELPPFGAIPLEGFVEALVTDFLAHTWDVGAPAGLPVRLDPQLIPGAFAWSRRAPLRGPGGVGPELTPPPDADDQTRFLAFLGRREPVSASRG